MKVLASLVVFLLLFVSMAHAGNFGEFNSLAISHFKLVPAPEVKGFKMYKSSGGAVLIGVGVKEDWVVDSFVVCKGTATVNDLVYSVAFLYSTIQDSRHKLKNQEDAEIIIAGGTELWKNRANKIIKDSYNQLYHSNEATFIFDNIGVKAMDVGELKWRVSPDDNTKDPKKMITIKLWMK